MKIHNFNEYIESRCCMDIDIEALQDLMEEYLNEIMGDSNVSRWESYSAFFEGLFEKNKFFNSIMVSGALHLMKEIAQKEYVDGGKIVEVINHIKDNVPLIWNDFEEFIRDSDHDCRNNER